MRVFHRKYCGQTQPLTRKIMYDTNLSDGKYLKCSELCCTDSEEVKIGKSVEYALHPDVKYWFPIRATHHRAQKIYDKIASLRNDCLEPYLPILRHIEYTNEDFNNPTQYIADKPLDTGLLFLRSTLNDFRALLQYESMFPGMNLIIIIFTPTLSARTNFSPFPKGRWRVSRL